MGTADDDSGSVPYDTFRLPRAVLNWKPRYRAPVLRLDLSSGSRAESRASSGSRAESRASTDEFEDEPTKTFEDEPTRTFEDEPTRTFEDESASMMEVSVLSRAPERSEAFQILLARAAARFDAARARAAQLWRDGPLRTAAMIGGVALITYLAVGGGVRHGSSSGTQTVLAPAAALPALGPIIVEQLNGALQPRETGAAPLRGEQSDRPSRRNAVSRARETSLATALASKSGGFQAIAPAQSKAKSRRAEHSSTTVASSLAGLPAWGAETVHDFSGGKGSTSATRDSQALTAKPPSSSANVPPPMAAYRPTATATAPAREQTKPAPVVAAKPAEPPKPVAPPRPSKPLTMDEMLNQVEEVAQAQRKQAGLKAPETSQRDAELDELISGAMKSKKK